MAPDFRGEDCLEAGGDPPGAINKSPYYAGIANTLYHYYPLLANHALCKNVNMGKELGQDACFFLPHSTYFMDPTFMNTG